MCRNNSLLGGEFFGIEHDPGDLFKTPTENIVYKQHYKMIYLTLEYKHFWKLFVYVVDHKPKAEWDLFLELCNPSFH